jgi:putative Holliday junction resolvase
MYLGIDLGEKTTGLAISEGLIASPYKTIKHKNTKDALSLVIQIIKLEHIDTVVIGYVEGKINKLFTDFAKNLRSQKPELTIIMQDETLTSLQATELQIKLSVPKTKRKEKEHEVAAAFILQSYLDSIN